MTDTWRRRDIAHLWHPYTEITEFEQSAFPVIERASGSRLYSTSGEALLDGISSWWCVNLGHGHPELVKAIHEQAGRLQHTLLGGISHPPAIELAEQLTRLAPPGLHHVMFASDGASAVEAALKIALQYWHNQGESGRTRFISLQGGYHGDTLGTIGVGYVDSFHRPFRSALTPALFAAAPLCTRCIQSAGSPCDCFDSMAALVRANHAECAAVIVEPLCQAAAGIRIYSEDYLRRLRALCDEYRLPLIVDEIAVGFGRTGSLFASQRAGIAPDIMTVGKGLTGGMLPMSATLVSGPIYDSFRARGEQKRTFFHGHTFCGNPLACAAALAALPLYEEVLASAAFPQRVAELEQGMKKITSVLECASLRTLGMIAAIEIADEAGGAGRARRIGQRAQELGLLIRPLGNIIYLWPPLNVSSADLEMMLALLDRATRETE
ncbi:MAG: adenosylmethionine--8-amino-7-oxononanoate transaminase [Brachymonas sp.]|jgi:adenosylmethionine-8-amino-7-oxononanoate aminotransferase|nr:adenosylmethionine--8-amino-7-oxononanoate transaminase [Brachymonas sp.]